jgi:hypothetical protein
MICFSGHHLLAQRISTEEYIRMYSDLAVSEMERSGIPASITLAQGILESGSGNSRLSVQGNNHFGIKCHGWEGEEIIHDDDLKGECFRKYRNANESYLDHTDFLTGRSRYAFLFDYKSTDYKNWAQGLKKAGYATDPRYAQLLIGLIERYRLHEYDADVVADGRKPTGDRPRRKDDAWNDFASFNIEHYPVHEYNGTDYITARQGDTYNSLSEYQNLMPWQLPKYNDAQGTDSLRQGEVVYLQPKRRKAQRSTEIHRVKEGETMRFISQKYAVKLTRLYVLNRMEEGSQPAAGDVLNLRKKKKK